MVDESKQVLVLEEWTNWDKLVVHKVIERIFGRFDVYGWFFVEIWFFASWLVFYKAIWVSLEAFEEFSRY